MSAHDPDDITDEGLREELEALGYWMASFHVVIAFIYGLLRGLMSIG